MSNPPVAGPPLPESVVQALNPFIDSLVLPEGMDFPRYAAIVVDAHGRKWGIFLSCVDTATTPTPTEGTP